MPSVSRSVTPPGIPPAAAPARMSWYAVGEPPADSASLFKPDEKSLSLEKTKSAIRTTNVRMPTAKLMVWKRKYARRPPKLISTHSTTHTVPTMNPASGVASEALQSPSVPLPVDALKAANTGARTRFAIQKPPMPIQKHCESAAATLQPKPMAGCSARLTYTYSPPERGNDDENAASTIAKIAVPMPATARLRNRLLLGNTPGVIQ